MNTAIREAIRALLLDDNELAGLLGAPTAVYHRISPADSPNPYALFFKQSGIEVGAYAGPSYKNQLWLVEGVVREPDAGKAEAIDARCAALLEDAAIEIEGADTMALFRETDVEYGEVDNGDQIHYVGGSYRLVVQPT